LAQTTPRTPAQAAGASAAAQYQHYLSDHEKRWEGDTLHFSGAARGFKANGTVAVTDAEVIIDGKLPLIAKPFEPRIKSTIEREAAAMFG
jgi:hypothetical protein